MEKVTEATRFLVVLVFVAAAMVACSSSSSTAPAPGPTVTSIAAEPENRTPLFVSRTKQFKAIATYSDGTTADITNSVTWQSSDPTKATIDEENGLATGVAAGTTNITAVDTATSTTSTAKGLTVSAATLTSITVSQKSAGDIPVGLKKEMQAVGTFSDNHTEDLTQSATWTTADGAIATVSDTAGEKGLVTGVGAGTVAITATDASGPSGSANVVVQAPAVTVSSLAISPNNPAILPGRYGFKQQFTCEATLSDGNTYDATESATWTSSSTTNATVSDEAGTKGLATAVAEGSAQITATIGSVSKFATLTVNDDAVDALRISPATPSPIPVGYEQIFTLTGVFTSGAERDMTGLDSVLWRASGDRTAITATTVASVSNLTEPFNYKGFVQGLAVGTAYVSAAESGTNTAATSIEIEVTSPTLDAIAIFLVSDSGEEGITELSCYDISGVPLQQDTFQFKATGFYSDGNETDLTQAVTWSSDDTDVVIVKDQPADEKGFVGCGAQGTATINAIVPNTGVQANVTVTVADRP